MEGGRRREVYDGVWRSFGLLPVGSASWESVTILACSVFCSFHATFSSIFPVPAFDHWPCLYIPLSYSTIPAHGIVFVSFSLSYALFYLLREIPFAHMNVLALHVYHPSQSNIFPPHAPEGDVGTGRYPRVPLSGMGKSASQPFVSTTKEN